MKRVTPNNKDHASVFNKLFKYSMFCSVIFFLIGCFVIWEHYHSIQPIIKDVNQSSQTLRAELEKSQEVNRRISKLVNYHLDGTESISGLCNEMLLPLSGVIIGASLFFLGIALECRKHIKTI